MSNLIKPSHYIPVSSHLQLAPSQWTGNRELNRSSDDQPPMTAADIAVAEIETIKEQLLRDAESFAEDRIHEALEQAEQMRDQARSEIEQWWEQRRQEDEQHKEEARNAGYQDGYRHGAEEAERDVREEFERMLNDARSVLEQAYDTKQKMIMEAEPFLLELSCAIAEKIVDRQLTLERSWVIDQIRTLLARRQDLGKITLCVSPADFEFVLSSREELSLAIDSQAELQIVPDASVEDRGCVIRSAFGSIDARIDTQLTEIKKELHHVAQGASSL